MIPYITIYHNQDNKDTKIERIACLVEFLPTEFGRTIMKFGILVPYIKSNVHSSTLDSQIIIFSRYEISMLLRSLVMTKVTYPLMIILRVYPPSTYHSYLSLLIYDFSFTMYSIAIITFFECGFVSFLVQPEIAANVNDSSLL